MAATPRHSDNPSDLPLFPTPDPRPDLALVIVTRFNLQTRGAKRIGLTAENLPQWLERRTTIFEDFTLPAMRAQTDPNFLWVVLFGADRTPPWLHEKIKKWRQWHQFAPYFAEEPFSSDLASRAAVTTLKDRGKWPVRWIGTGWQDTDDVVTCRYIERIREAFDDTECAICHPTGLRVPIDLMYKNIVRDTQSGFKISETGPLLVRQPQKSTAMVRFEKCLPNSSIKTVYEVFHFRQKRITQVVDIQKRTPSFVKITHADAIINRTERFFDNAPAKRRMPARTRLINKLIRVYGFQSYLEIGIGAGRNFFNVALDDKIAVDPDAAERDNVFPLSSDEFFESNSRTFDLIFIDGLHLRDQLHRDIANSLDCLNPGGLILCHDVNPRREIHQRVPRESRAWTGDCWKAWVELRERDDLEMWVVDIGPGMGVIRPGGQSPLGLTESLNWENLTENRESWLNLMTEEEAFEKIYRELEEDFLLEGSE